MKKLKKLFLKISFLAVLVLALAFTISKASAFDEVKIEENKPLQEIISKKLDPKAEILSAYLAKFNSPLENHAQDFIDAANQYNLDWKLVAAISGVESTFGKHIPGGYNGWGWGVYGTQAIYFTSWREGIFTVSKGLKEDYISRGLLDPYSMNKRYATSPTWGRNVSFFMNDLEKFAENYKAEIIDSGVIAQASKEAATSGLLAFKE